MTRCFYFFCLILLAGCIPIPTKVNTMPNVKGSVRVDGKTLVNIPIKLCTQFYDEIDCVETITDEQGNFYISQKSKLGFVSLGDAQHGYKLSVQKDGQELSWTYGRMGQIPSQTDISCSVSEKLICELNSNW